MIPELHIPPAGDSKHRSEETPKQHFCHTFWTQTQQSF